jgi:hypothetical protein
MDKENTALGRIKAIQVQTFSHYRKTIGCNDCSLSLDGSAIANADVPDRIKIREYILPSILAHKTE